MHRRAFLFASAALATGRPTFGRKTQEPIDLDTLLEVTKTPALAGKGVIAGKPFRQLAGVAEGSMFSAASLTKPVFTMEVRRLVREGKLAWDKPLQDYMPLGLTGDAASITAEHVLTHGTGLSNWRFDPKEQELRSSFKPGTAWQYSGEGYVLLQRVVERLAGEPLGAYLNRTLLPRLGMMNSTFTWSPAIEKIAVAGHDNRGNVLQRDSAFYNRSTYTTAEKAGSTPDRMTYDEYFAAATKLGTTPLAVGYIPNAAGSLWTTVDDYFSFLEKTLRDFADHPEEYTPRNRVNRKISWTLSWGIDSSLDAPAYFHWGDGPGVKNFAWWQPAKKTALVIFTNSDHGAPAYRMLLRQLLRADPVSPEWI